MKVKVGQWVRTNQSEFYEVNESICRDCGNVEVIRNRNEGLIFTTCINVEEIIKVADTPQELLKVGDLFSTKLLLPLPVTRIHKDIGLLKSYEDTFSFEVITAIYTPNEDKTEYTEQWRKE